MLLEARTKGDKDGLGIKVTDENGDYPCSVFHENTVIKPKKKKEKKRKEKGKGNSKIEDGGQPGIEPGTSRILA